MTLLDDYTRHIIHGILHKVMVVLGMTENLWAYTSFLEQPLAVWYVATHCSGIKSCINMFKFLKQILDFGGLII